LTRKSTNPLRYDTSSATQSESGMNCRGMIGFKDANNAVRCISMLSSGIGGPSEMTNLAAVSSLSGARSVSKF
jgi:hypothetical protein